MRLDWLEDILAVLDTGSFGAAAERRSVTQPAFSRRIRAIEARLGVELFDRSRKPVALNPNLAAHEREFRRTATQLRAMMGELQRAGREAHGRVVVASQHAITATLAPELIGKLFRDLDVTVRLRSANREDCLALLMTRQADMMIVYQTEAEAAGGPGEFLQRAELGCDRLVPVFAAFARARLQEFLDQGELPIVAYPRDAFLGRVLLEDLQPRIAAGYRVRARVETALTMASLECARKGIGVAWVPENIARPALADGTLTELGHMLPTTSLRIAALRLNLSHGQMENRLWALVSGDAPPPLG